MSNVPEGKPQPLGPTDDVNRYGGSIPRGDEFTEAPSLVDEMIARGISIEPTDMEALSDQSVWPADIRARLIGIVEALEQFGTRFEIQFKHGGTNPATIQRVIFDLQGE